jgi:SAM-dependent methyltransferase
MARIKVEDQYFSGEYLAHNPDWHRQDCFWKASLVKDVLEEFKLEANSLCEIGCGTGDISVYLKKFYPQSEFSGYDISPQAERFWDRHIDTGVRFYCGDFLTLNKEVFDCILLIDIIEHLSNPFQFLEGVVNRAKYFIIHFPLDLNSLSVLLEKPLLASRSRAGHIHYFTKGLALAILRDTGFRIVHCRYTNATSNGPGRNLKTRMAALPRRLVSFLDKDFGVRLLGGETLIVLADTPRNDG